MKKPQFYKAILLFSLITFILSGCFYYVQQPLDTDFSKTELGTKKGESYAYELFWVFAWGNAGSKSAAENGNLKIIRHADTSDFILLYGLYAKRTTIVYGD